MIKKIRNAAKEILGMGWLKSEISKTATGTAIGHGLGELIAKLPNRKSTGIEPKDEFYLPSRTELYRLLTKLPEEDRRFYEERLKEADTSPDTPSLEDTILALCFLARSEYQVLLRDVNGNPILNDKGEPVYITKQGPKEEELVDLFSRYAQSDKDSFWRWIKILINDENLQRLKENIQSSKKETFADSLKDVLNKLQEWNEKQREEAQKYNEAFKKKIEKRRKEIEEEKKQRKIKWFPFQK